MIILLPPSEGKTPAASGRPLDLDTLAFPELAGPRSELLDELTTVSARPDALDILGVGQSLAADVERNLALTEIPCAPAIETYTGVLYSALDSATLGSRGAKRLDRLFVSSALFGIVNAHDRIPAYRLAMKTRLPGTGVLSTWWKRRLAPVLDAAFGTQLIVDCRSTDYRKSWPGPPERTVAVDVFTERDGKRSVVSHNAKHARGLVARHLLRRAGADPQTTDELERAAAETFRVETVPATARKPAALQVILTA